MWLPATAWQWRAVVAKPNRFDCSFHQASVEWWLISAGGLGIAFMDEHLAAVSFEWFGMIEYWVGVCWHEIRCWSRDQTEAIWRLYLTWTLGGGSEVDFPTNFENDD